MATAPPTPAQVELISSLSQDEIPIKLRCAICSKLAVNAYRLPCCDQAICETCHSSLPSSCPVCEHTPVSAEDCKPNKSLRTTIKVFLRTEEKKREAFRLKELKDTPPITPVTPAEVTAQIDTLQELEPRPLNTGEESVAQLSTPDVEVDLDEDIGAPNTTLDEEVEVEQDIPQLSIEEIAPEQELAESEGNVDHAHEPHETAPGDQHEEHGSLGNGDGMSTDVSQTPGFGMGFGYDASAGFPMMGQGADMSQMQMLAMQNAMAPNLFGSFPMMGMPGMSMDPMAMQSMYLNGGFGAQGMGIGMNGMNMGMGMAGFDGGMGTGFNNGWNGQQSWNIGQDNFNNPNATSMGYGDFGNNSGYHQHAAGYNQGNYGRNQYIDNGYGSHSQGYYRGRGRGRGYGYQRGGYGQNGRSDFSQQRIPDFQNGPNGQMNYNIPNGPKADTATSLDKVDEFGREIREPEAKDSNDTATNNEAVVDTERQLAENETEHDVSQEPLTTDPQAPEDIARPIQTLEEIESAREYHVSDKRLDTTGWTGSGSMQPLVAAIVPDVPINAPTGPRAMREGLPNTSVVHLRARGLAIPGHGKPVLTAVSPVKSESQEKENTRDRSKTPVSRSKSRSRSRSEDREERYRRRNRHRSTSMSDDGKEEERRRERRHRHSRNNEDETLVESNGNSNHQSRSQSPVESRRSSHRRRDREKERDKERDRDYERERDKDRDRDRDREKEGHRSEKEHRSSSHKHRSSHRSQRDRSRSRERERDRSRSRERDRDRSRSRDRDRDRDHRHRKRHESQEPQEQREAIAQVPEQEKPMKIPSGPRAMSMSTNGIEIKGGAVRKSSLAVESHIDPQQRLSREKDRQDRERSNRHREDRESEPKTSSKSSQPQVDPHTLEREARNRERLLKEAQRMAGLAGAAGTGLRKRSRDEDDDSRKGRKSRRKSERFEDEDEDEERMARLESEREGGRWG